MLTDVALKAIATGTGPGTPWARAGRPQASVTATVATKRRPHCILSGRKGSGGNDRIDHVSPNASVRPVTTMTMIDRNEIGQ